VPSACRHTQARRWSEREATLMAAPPSPASLYEFPRMYNAKARVHVPRLFYVTATPKMYVRPFALDGYVPQHPVRQLCPAFALK